MCGYSARQDVVDLVVAASVWLVPRVTRIGLVDGCIWVAHCDPQVRADVCEGVVDVRELREVHVGGLVIAAVDAPLDEVGHNAALFGAGPPTVEHQQQVIDVHRAGLIDVTITRAAPPVDDGQDVVQRRRYDRRRHHWRSGTGRAW